MIIIKQIEDISRVRDNDIKPYITDYFKYLIKAYCANDSIEAVGAIYYFENIDDFMEYQSIGLSAPITENRFEWIEEIGHGYSNGCIVLNNDKAINIIAKSTLFQERI